MCVLKELRDGHSSDGGGETEASRRGQGCLPGSPRGGGIKGDPWAPGVRLGVVVVGGEGARTKVLFPEMESEGPEGAFRERSVGDGW